MHLLSVISVRSLLKSVIHYYTTSSHIINGPSCTSAVAFQASAAQMRSKLLRLVLLCTTSCCSIDPDLILAPVTPTRARLLLTRKGRCIHQQRTSVDLRIRPPADRAPRLPAGIVSRLKGKWRNLLVQTVPGEPGRAGGVFHHCDGSFLSQLVTGHSAILYRWLRFSPSLLRHQQAAAPRIAVTGSLQTRAVRQP